MKTKPIGLRRQAYLAAGLTGAAMALVLFLILPYEPVWTSSNDRGVELLGFSSDGRRLLTVEDRWKLGTIRTRDVTGAVRTIAVIQEPPLVHFDFWRLSSDAQVLAHVGKLESGQRVARLFDTTSGNTLKVMPLAPDVSSLEFSPSRLTLALGYIPSEGKPAKIELVDANTGKVTKSFNNLPDSILAIRFSLDGTTLVVSTGHGINPDSLTSNSFVGSSGTHTTLQVYDIPSGQLRRQLDQVFAPSVLQDGRMILFRYDASQQKLIWLRYVVGDATGAPEAESAITWQQPLHPKAAQAWWPQLSGTNVVLESWGYDKATNWQKLCSTMEAGWWMNLCRYLGWGPTQGLVAVQQMKTYDVTTGKARYDVTLYSPELGCTGLVAPGGKAIAWSSAGRRLEYWEAPIQPPWFLIMGISGLSAAFVLLVLRLRRWHIRRREARLVSTPIEAQNIIYRRRSTPSY